jgi:hypothetical protein
MTPFAYFSVRNSEVSSKKDSEIPTPTHHLIAYIYGRFTHQERARTSVSMVTQNSIRFKYLYNTFMGGDLFDYYLVTLLSD